MGLRLLIMLKRMHWQCAVHDELLSPEGLSERLLALAIAKCRRIILLTGDWALRKAAKEEGVSVMGTIGILDRLYDGAYIWKRRVSGMFEAVT